MEQSIWRLREGLRTAMAGAAGESDAVSWASASSKVPTASASPAATASCPKNNPASVAVTALAAIPRLFATVETKSP